MATSSTALRAALRMPTRAPAPVALRRRAVSDDDVSIVVHSTDGTDVGATLESLRQACSGRRPEVVLVDGRTAAAPSLDDVGLEPRIVVPDGRGRAAARNAGLRAATREWAVMLDSDTVVDPRWYDDLLSDLGRAGRRAAGVAASSAAVASLDSLGSDLAYRRLVALCLGGLPERFQRHAAPDVELVDRMIARGWALVPGRRRSRPVEETPASGRATTTQTPEPLGEKGLPS
ncbi:MAG: glycosyltransferase family A protein [Candidatus Nanopelagicales bacterium]